MTPSEFKAIRLRAGLTQGQLAARLRVEDTRTIRRYETGERTISGPVSLVMEQIEASRLCVLPDPPRHLVVAANRTLGISEPKKPRH